MIKATRLPDLFGYSRAGTLATLMTNGDTALRESFGRARIGRLRECSMLEPTPRDQNLAPREAMGESAFLKLYVHKDVFCELQAIQRSQSSPKFDLKDICSSALRIVFALPDATGLIKEQVMKDFVARRRP